MIATRWLPRAALIAACAALVACGGESTAPSGPAADAPAPPTAPAAVTSDAARQVAAANAAFGAGRFVSPPGDNALEWFAAARERDPAHLGIVEALVDLYPIALAAAERALAEGDRAEAQRIIDLLDRAQPDSLGTRLLRERLRTPAADAGLGSQPPAATASPAVDPRQAEASAERPQQAPPAAAAPVAQAPGEPAAPPAAAAAEPAPPAPAPAPVRNDASPPAAAQPVAEAFAPPRLLSRVEPAYPQLARQRRIEGWVELEFLVATDGTPRDIEVVESSPNAIFDAAAARALQRWRFEPARRGGAVEAARTRTRITFRLG